VRLLIACLAYQVMHIARRAMEKTTGTGWSLRRLRERVLRAGAPQVPTLHDTGLLGVAATGEKDSYGLDLAKGTVR
jgi:hypothetical protein